MSESTLNPHKWTVRRKSSGKFKPFTVMDPTHMCDDGDRQWWFATFDEAIRFAQREAFRDKLIEDFSEYLDTVQDPWRTREYQHTGLDTMCRMFQWWGKYDLPGFLENI